MTDHRREQALERRIVAALDRDAEALDPALSQRLDRARRTAMGQAHRLRRPRFVWPALVTAASAALVAVVVMIQPADDGEGVPALPMTEDLDLLTQEEFELFSEDPEFYAWIAERPAQRQRRERLGREEEST